MLFSRKKISDEQWNELNEEVMRLTREGKLDQAAARGKELFAAAQKGYGKKHPNTATALNNLGIVHTLRCEFDEAESYLLAALQVSEQASGAISSEVAVVNINLARLYSMKAKNIEEKLAARDS